MKYVNALKQSAESRPVGEAINVWIGRIMTMVASDPQMLAEVIGGGRFTWRTTFIKAFQGFPVSLDLADKVFGFFEQQHARAFGGLSSKFVLDKLEVPTPPSQADIDRAWTVDSASSEAGKRDFYGPDGSPQQLLEQLIDAGRAAKH